MKRVYIVRAIHEVEMPILASSEEEAREIADKNIEDAFRWDDGHERCITNKIRPAGKEDLKSIPWGQDVEGYTIKELIDRGACEE